MTHQPKHTTSRRAFLGTAAATALSVPALTQSAVADGHAAASDEIAFEVTRTEEEWRALLSETEYRILREEGTEPRFSSDYVDEDAAGVFHCRGCDLPIYDSEWKTPRLIGWVFFYHARPNSVLTGIDEWPAVYGDSGMSESRFVIEAHCRRCGSHFGHMIQVQDDILHCINGAALNFVPEEAA